MKFQTDKLKKIRKEMMTQHKFAINIHVSEDHYIKIENGYNHPSVPVFLRICKEINKPAQYLFTSQNTFLNKEEMEKLMGYKEEDLKTILSVLQSLYENIEHDHAEK